MVMLTAEGPISLAQEQLSDAFANSAKFQEVTGEANATDAANHIIFDILERPVLSQDEMTLPEIEADRPFLAILSPVTDILNGQSNANNAQFDFTGSFQLLMEVDVSDIETLAATVDRDKAQEVYRWANNTIGVMFKEASTYAEANSSFFRFLQTIVYLMGLDADEKSLGKHLVFTSQWSWGVSL